MTGGGLKNRITAITIAVLEHDPDLTARLARRAGGIDVWANGKTVFRLWIPHKALPAEATDTEIGHERQVRRARGSRR